MYKQGVKFDYDLKANEHVKKEDTCIICNNKLNCRWTDFHGEGVCMNCGAPYQLINGSEEQKKENKYPYLNIQDEWIKVVKEYWEQTHRFVFLGTSLSEETGQKEFFEWVDKNHPEMKETS